MLIWFTLSVRWNAKDCYFIWALNLGNCVGKIVERVKNFGVEKSAGPVFELSEVFYRERRELLRVYLVYVKLII